MYEVKTVVFGERSRAKMLHIEAPGCIINVHIGLKDMSGNKVTAIAIKCDEYSGEPKVYLPDFNNAKTLNVRVLTEKES